MSLMLVIEHGTTFVKIESVCVLSDTTTAAVYFLFAATFEIYTLVIC